LCGLGLKIKISGKNNNVIRWEEDIKQTYPVGN
jgi:hypothetical protein